MKRKAQSIHGEARDRPLAEGIPASVAIAIEHWLEWPVTAKALHSPVRSYEDLGTAGPNALHYICLAFFLVALFALAFTVVYVTVTRSPFPTPPSFYLRLLRHSYWMPLSLSVSLFTLVFVVVYVTVTGSSANVECRVSRCLRVLLSAANNKLIHINWYCLCLWGAERSYRNKAIIQTKNAKRMQQLTGQRNCSYTCTHTHAHTHSHTVDLQKYTSYLT